MVYNIEKFINYSILLYQITIPNYYRVTKMEMETAAYPSFYPGLSLEVFAPAWYYRGQEEEDEYSKKILSSKKKDESDYFIPKIKELADDLVKESKLQDIDLIVTIPKSNLSYSKTLDTIAKSIKCTLSSEYENIIERTSTGRRNLGGNSAKKRFEQTNGSMKLKRNLKPNEENILILDDVKATGITILESAKILKSAGAKDIFCICLGISRNVNMFPIKK